jgi:hypothetical protein
MIDSRTHMNDFELRPPKTVVSGESIAKVTSDFLLCVVDIPAFCIKAWDWLHMPVRVSKHYQSSPTLLPDMFTNSTLCDFTPQPC